VLFNRLTGYKRLNSHPIPLAVPVFECHSRKYRPQGLEKEKMMKRKDAEKAEFDGIDSKHRARVK
jgi:hypothetical protein